MIRWTRPHSNLASEFRPWFNLCTCKASPYSCIAYLLQWLAWRKAVSKNESSVTVQKQSLLNFIFATTCVLSGTLYVQNDSDIPRELQLLKWNGMEMEWKLCKRIWLLLSILRTQKSSFRWVVLIREHIPRFFIESLDPWDSRGQKSWETFKFSLTQPNRLCDTCWCVPARQWTFACVCADVATLDGWCARTCRIWGLHFLTSCI